MHTSTPLPTHLFVESSLSRRSWCAGVAAALTPWAWAAPDGATTPPLMLSTRYRPGLSLADYWVSEKYDGVRGYWNGSQLLTRAGNPVAAPAWFTAGWPTTPMDGELWAGRGRFSDAVSTVRQRNADDAAWRALRFMVFDLPAHGGPFSGRMDAMQTTVKQIGQSWVQVVQQDAATTEQALQRRLTQTVQAGGEGLMLHHGDAHYVAQRSERLRKLKPFEDAEAQIVGHVMGQGRHQGRLGALWVEIPALEGQSTRRFKLGTGLSDALRDSPPPVGTWVTYRYQGLTGAGVPRFASFLRVAADKSL